MSNVNIRLKYIFVHIPKTGGRSMTGVRWNQSTIFSYYGHYSIRDIKDFGISDLSPYFKWCFVRNPWDRLLSAYDFSAEFKEQFPTFENFVDTVYQHKDHYSKMNYKWSRSGAAIKFASKHAPEVFLFNQLSFMTINDELCMDFIGRFENIHDDWIKVCEKIKSMGCQGFFLESDYVLPQNHMRKNRKDAKYIEKPYKEYYSEKMKQKVGEIYYPDIAKFGYNF